MEEVEIKATNISICFATDENYAKYMSASIVSILETSKHSDNLNFYILCNNVSDYTKNKIEQLKKIKNFNIKFIDVDIDEFKNFPAGGPHITNTAYFRYKIAELLPNISKIIYLDCDVIVKQSLSELFEMDLTEYYLAGVEDVGYYYWKNYDPKYIYKDGFYINSGVLLINLNEWQKNDLFHKLMNFTIKEANKITIGDQDVINQVCIGKIKELDYKWNVQDSFYRAEPERAYNPNYLKIIYASENPAIIHYTYVKKPWNDLSVTRADDFWNSYSKTPFYNDMEKLIYNLYANFSEKLNILSVENGTLKFNINALLKEKKPSFLQKIFSVKNERNHKVVRTLGFKLKFRRNTCL